MRKDIKPIFKWAKQNGDANIYDRILMKVMPNLIKENLKLTSKMIENSETIEVSTEVYDLIVTKAEELVGVKYV
ncbi:MAG: hypothetical protein U9Q04_09545 [Campylobacterota bacterium]|nr:hypothetical protein [Campylobacterota bacterium]